MVPYFHISKFSQYVSQKKIAMLSIPSRTNPGKSISVERLNIQLKLGGSSLRPRSLTSTEPIPCDSFIPSPSMIKNSWWNTLLVDLSTFTLWKEVSLCYFRDLNEPQPCTCNIAFQADLKEIFNIIEILQSTAFTVLLENDPQPSSVNRNLEKVINYVKMNLCDSRANVVFLC